MRKNFPEFYREKLNIKKLDKDYLIVFDANSLLNVFRFSKKASDKLLEAIESKENEMYIPHQVALEFNYNRKSVQVEFQQKKNNFKRQFDSSWTTIPDILYKNFDQLSIRSGDTKEIEIEFKEKLNNLLEEMKKTIDKNLVPALLNSTSPENDNFEKLLDLLEDKIGNPYTQEEIKEIEDDGKNRYGNEIPPGFDDNDKKDKRTYNNITYQRKYGDLLIWKNLLSVAAERQLKHLIFVSSDGDSSKKSDWLFRAKGIKVGPRIELLNEMKNNSNTEFHMINESEYIKQILGETEDVTGAVKDIESYFDHINVSDFDLKIRGNNINKKFNLKEKKELYEKLYRLKFLDEISKDEEISNMNAEIDMNNKFRIKSKKEDSFLDYIEETEIYRPWLY